MNIDSEPVVVVEHRYKGWILVDDKRWKRHDSGLHVHICSYKHLHCNVSTEMKKQAAEQSARPGPWLEFSLVGISHNDLCAYCALLDCDPMASFADFAHLEESKRQEWIETRIASMCIKPAKR